MGYQLRTRRDAYRGSKWKKGALRNARPPMTLNLAPMIDVTFLLLIFFSVTTTFKRAEGYFGAKLPKDAGQPSVALPISPVIVRIEQYGPGDGDYRIRLDNFLTTPATFDDLTNFLKQVQQNPGFDADTPVVIAAEPDVRWDYVVSCWNAAVRAGCHSISFGK